MAILNLQWDDIIFACQNSTWLLAVDFEDSTFKDKKMVEEFQKYKDILKRGTRWVQEAAGERSKDLEILFISIKIGNIELNKDEIL